MKKKLTKTLICLTTAIFLIAPTIVHASEMKTQQLPGDYLNSCKIVATTKYDNVTYNNYEQKVIQAILDGAVGGIGFAFTKSAVKAFFVSSIRGSFGKVPKQKNIWVTVQHRQCKDNEGLHKQLIIKSYSNSARTKQISTQYKWAN
ncbi:hypothetical protein ABEY09_28225 [Bacillus paranthracis]|uniref:hypothetical protein n=1 Tax=Bacillus TaxID=1386 RepID=UPI001267A8A5|nr:hypothetical protein [Bacillus subtilis]MEC0314336.1 hypothetical protein [Bacillus subtilis]MEC0363581.1 hypothetical protein [Bacillus subtilis]HEO2443948.1 hypothetical protein [Streptococcus agalactiae]